MADFEMDNMGSPEHDFEGASLSRNSKSSNSAYQDPVADMLLGYYKAFYLDEAEKTRYILLASPLSLIVIFYVFISQSTSSIISFTAFIFSLVFLGISMWMLCEILKKDCGPRAMQDIAEVIREGSEGFFVT